MLNQTTIKARLTFIIAVMFGLIVMVGGIGVYGIVSSTEQAVMLMNGHVRPSILLGQIRFLQAENRSQVMLGLQHDSVSPFAKMHDHPLDLHTENIRKNAEKITELMDAYAKRNIDDAKERELFEKFRATRDAYVKDGLKPASEALSAGEFLRANEILLTKINPMFRFSAETGTALEKHILNAAEEEQQKLETHFRFLLTTSGVLALVGLALVVGMGFMLMRAIVVPLNNMVSHFDAIAQGDLSRKVDIGGNNEITHVQEGLARLQRDLVGVIGGMRESASMMTNSASQLQREMDLIAKNSNAQQQGIEGVAAAMQEMSVSVNEVARSTDNTSRAASSSAKLAKQGREQTERTMGVTRDVVAVMETSSATMHSLQDSVAKIGAVTNVIREVAEQTNLLALNAAIEAARAGEQGRGFAVVADEVRKLAERTSSSTADIARIVEEVSASSNHAVVSMQEAQEKIAQVQASVSQSNDSLTETLSAADTVSALATQIATASNEQATAANSVAQSMEENSRFIADTHARIGEVQQESARLAEAAQQMDQMVSRFRV